MKEHVQVVQKNVKGGGEAVYGLGIIGAFVYFMTHANSFIDVLWGIFKALFWPAFLVYHLLDFLRL